MLRTIADAPGSALPPPPPPGTPTPARLSRSGLGRLRTAPHRTRSIPRPPRASRSDSRMPPAAQLGLGSPRGPPASRHSHHLRHRHRCPSRPPPPPPALGPSAAAAAPRLLPRRRRRALCPPPEQRGRGIACGAHRRRRASCGRCLDSGTGPTPRGGRAGGREAGSCRRGRAADPASPAALAERGGLGLCLRARPDGSQRAGDPACVRACWRGGGSL